MNPEITIPRRFSLPSKFDLQSSSISRTAEGGDGTETTEEDFNHDDGPVFLQAQWQQGRTPTTVEEAKLNEQSSRAEESSTSLEQNGLDFEEEDLGTAAWRQRLKSSMHQRVAEQAELLSIVRRLSTSSCDSKEIILLSGPCGSGKTHLAKTLQPHVVEAGGYFLTGKFDRLNLMSPAPYTAFCSAFTEFATIVLKRGDEVVQQVRSDIRSALGSEAAVLTRMIPGLEPLCGHDDDFHCKGKTDDAIQRFLFVFRTFLRAVASPEHPIVLLLDDIHFADLCSLSVLASVLADRHQSCGLVVLCTVDDRPDKHPSYLCMKLRELEDSGTVIHHMVLSHLEISQVGRLLKECLDVPEETVASLSGMVLQQTDGNPSDVIEFLCWLRDADLLYLDQETGMWCWDADDIAMTINTRRVNDYLVDKLEQLPHLVKEVLKVSACLGPKLNPQLLEYVLSTNVQSVLAVAAEKGAIVHDVTRGEYVFEHDRIQSASYAMIPEGDRELYHLEVGRRMWRRLDEKGVDRYLFTLLSQMNIGRRHITRERERIAVATLCLHAGVKAARSSTFRIALVYLDFGLSLLDEVSWRLQYDLTLALHNAAAEMAVCTSNFDRADQLIDSVLKHAKVLSDKTQAYATRVYGLAAVNKQKEAIEMGFQVLEELGESLPRCFSRRAVRSEFRAVRTLLRGKSDEQLLRMPLMTDKCKLACLQILNSNQLSALLTHPQYLPFISLRMVKITMKYGASVFAASSFGNYGMLLLSLQQDVESAFRYGTLAEKFLSRFKAKEYLPRVHAAFFGCIYAWRRPVKDAVGPLLEGYRVGLQTGDLEGAFLCANLYCLNAMEAGSPIPVVEREWEHFRESMSIARYEAFMRVTVTNLQIMHHVSGITKDPLASHGDLIDFDVEMHRAKERKDYMMFFVLSIGRMILCYWFNDLEGASLHIDALRHLDKVPPSIRKMSCSFYGGLVVLACARDGRNVRRNMRLARTIIKAMERLATLSPSTCLDKLFLLEAEYASVTGKNDEAHKKYTCAVAMSKDSGFLHCTAIGYELWARHLFRVGDHGQSRTYFGESLHSYRDYGASRKVERLEMEVKELFDGKDSGEQGFICCDFSSMTP